MRNFNNLIINDQQGQIVLTHVLEGDDIIPTPGSYVQTRAASGRVFKVIYDYRAAVVRVILDD
jgi:hypothetical protein